MLSTLRISLDNKELNYRQSSLLQGVLYEHADADYVERMHQQNLHPYSQHIINDDGHTIWVISTLTDEAREKLIDPLNQDSFSEFKLKHRGDLEVHITDKEFETIDRKTLLDEFYERQSIRNVMISFLTPTAFKQRGRYMIMPDLRLLYQSLMMRYSASSMQIDMMDEDTLNEMVADSYVSGYRLASRSFPMEHTWIPGFIGNMTISFTKNTTVAHYIRLLLRFGEYSGVGIKTGMGMGAIQIMKEKSDDERR